MQLGMLAFQVENNESQMMGIKKKEYLRVLSDIVKESQQAQVRWDMAPYIGELLDVHRALQGSTLCSHPKRPAYSSSFEAPTLSLGLPIVPWLSTERFRREHRD